MATHSIAATHLLNFDDLAVAAVINRIAVSVSKRQPDATLRALYAFVASLPLGYNRNDDVSASEVLRDGYGQCNTKVTLLCALARGAGISTRIRAYHISKEAQRARAPAWLVFFMPHETLFVWPEFLILGKWTPLQALVATKPKAWDSCPFDGARYQLEPLRPEWRAHSLGVFASPDELFRKYKPSVYGWRALGWHLIGRRIMQARVQQSC